MEYRWIEDIEEFEKIAQEWDNKLLLSKSENPFLLSGFIITWWKYYSAGLQLRIFVVFGEGKVIGGLPLCQNNIGRLEYIGGINANYTECLSDRGSNSIWEILLKALVSRQDWRLLRLRRYRKERFNCGSSALKDLAKPHKVLLDMYPNGYSYLVRIPDDFSVFHNRIPKKLSYYIRRSMAEFSKLGHTDLYSVRRDDRIEEVLTKFIELSQSSFKKRNRESAFNNPRYCLFFKDVISTFHRLGYSDINILKLDDRIIAIHVGFSIGDNLNYIFTTYDADFSHINPGHLLIYKLIELASKRKNAFFDLYTGYQFYKEQWSNHKEEVSLIEIRPDIMQSRINRAVANALRGSPLNEKAKDFIRSSLILRGLVNRLKVILQNI